MTESTYHSARQEALQRDDYECQYCGQSADDAKIQTHHVVYERKGGPDSADNLVTLCKEHHGLVHGLGESGDDPIEVLSDAAIPKDWPAIRGLDSPVRVMLLDVLTDGDETEPWGYGTIQMFSDKTGLDSGYVRRALRGLTAAGWVERPYRGLYRFVDDPRTDDT